MWILGVAVAVVVALLVVMYVQGSRAIAARETAWADAARELGLRLERSADSEFSLSGHLAGLPVRVSEPGAATFQQIPAEAVCTEVEVGPLPWLPPETQVVRPRPGEARDGGPDRVESGDYLFDRVVHVRGPRTALLPMLGPDGRRALLVGLDEGDLQLCSGRLRMRKKGFLVTSGALVRFVRRVMAVVDGLDPKGQSPAERLARTVLHDRMEGAPRVAVAELARNYPQHPATRALVEKLAAQERLSRRILALDLLDEAGIPLAERIYLDPDGNLHTRSRAFRFLEAHGRDVPRSLAGRLSVAEEDDEAGRLSRATTDGGLSMDGER